MQSVLVELGLSHVARSRVGGRSGIRGISGGERRRCVAGWAGAGARLCQRQRVQGMHGGCSAWH